MGKVFTFGDVDGNRMPLHEDFDTVALKITDVLSVHEAPLAVQFYGSYANSRHGTRSDIDCLILYEERGELVEICRQLKSFGAQRFVPVNFTFLDISLIHTDFCHIGSMLQRHLSFVPEGML